jgi:hypothetical protein
MIGQYELHPGGQLDGVAIVVMTAIAERFCRYGALKLTVVMSEIDAVIEILPSADGISDILAIAE